MANPLLLGTLGNGRFPIYIGNTGGLTIEEIITLLPTSAISGSFIVSGGQVVWQSGLTFTVSAATYYIQGVRYNSSQANITLSTADGTNPRIDVIGVSTAGVPFKVTGTAAADPSEPDTDPLTQLQLAFVTVAAGASTPTSISNLTIYAENAGSGGAAEWDWTTSGAGWTLGSATTPRNGTKCIRAVNVAAGAYVQGQIGTGTVSLGNYTQLVLYIRNLNAWNSARALTATWYSTGIKRGNSIIIDNGFWGFDHNNTTDYQAIAIPTIQFGVPGATLVNQLRIAVVGSGGTFSFGIDDISLQLGATQTVAGLTQTQADARYLRYI